LKESGNDNAIFMIAPYWYEGTWVFDDPTTGLVREPFISGVPELINEIVRDIPDARLGFRLTYAAVPYRGFKHKLKLLRDEYNGSWYGLEGTSIKGWLCLALFKYFDRGPEHLYVQVDERD
jgi:hypothetical protein